MTKLLIHTRNQESFKIMAAFIWNHREDFDAGYNIEEDAFEFPMGPGGDLEEFERQLFVAMKKVNIIVTNVISSVTYCR